MQIYLFFIFESGYEFKRSLKHSPNNVNEVFVNGIPCRPGYQNKIDDINRILEANGKNFDYEFISSSNIEEHHLFRDKLHLNNQGVVVLATNFLTALGKPSYVDNFY